jgi:hypothetical protein
MYARSWVFVTLLAVSGFAARGEEPGFVSLIKGDDPKQFELVGLGPDTLKIVDGEIRVSGHPNGYFATKVDYRNYQLDFEWLYDRPEGLCSDAAFDGNSGLLIHVQRPHKVWPQSIEVQLYHPDSGNIFAITGAKFRGNKDAQAQKKAIKPAGQWNRMEVTCRDGTIVCKINGIEVARGQGASPDHGALGWQSEGSLIRFRKIQIKTLDRAVESDLTDPSGTGRSARGTRRWTGTSRAAD